MIKKTIHINRPIKITLLVTLFALTNSNCTLNATEASEVKNSPAPPAQTTLQTPQIALSEAINALSKEDSAEAMQNLFFAYIKQLQGLEFIVEQLALAVAQKKMGDPSIMDEIHNWLSSVKDLIGKARQAQLNRLNPDALIACFRVVSSLTEILSTEVDLQFQRRPLLSYESLFYRTNSGATLSQALFFAQSVEESLTRLSQKASDAGLSWFNKTYARFSEFFHRTGLLETGIKTATFGTVAFFSYLLFAPEKWISNAKLKELSISLKAKANTIFSAEHVDYAQKMVGIFTGLWALDQQIGISSRLKAAAYALDAKLRGIDSANQGITIPLLSDATDPSAPDLSSPLFDYLGHDLDPLRDIVTYLGNPQKYSTIKIEKGIILTGKPGSGKTFTAKAFINSCKKAAGRTAVIWVNSATLLANNGFDAIITQAKALAPCVICMDEGQGLAGGFQLDKNWAMLEEFLLALDSIDRDNDPQHQIWVVFVTSRPDLIYEPLRRPGRLGLQIEFFEPSFEHRKQILDTLCKKAGVSNKKINTELFARLTKGASASALNKLIEGAIRRAKLRNEVVSFEDVYESLNDGFRHLHKNIALTAKEREIVAAHLAGIVIAHLNLPLSTKLESVTIRAPQQSVSEQYDWQAKIEQNERTFFKPLYGTFFTYAENELISPAQETESRINAECMAILAGNAAEHILLGSTSSYDRTGFQRAYEVMLAGTTKNVALEKLPKQLSNTFKQAAWAKVEDCEKQITELLTTHKEKLIRISNQLKNDKDFLRINDIEELLKVKPEEPTTTPVTTAT